MTWEKKVKVHAIYATVNDSLSHRDLTHENFFPSSEKGETPLLQQATEEFHACIYLYRVPGWKRGGLRV